MRRRRRAGSSVGAVDLLERLDAHAEGGIFAQRVLRWRLGAPRRVQLRAQQRLLREQAPHLAGRVRKLRAHGPELLGMDSQRFLALRLHLRDGGLEGSVAAGFLLQALLLRVELGFKGLDGFLLGFALINDSGQLDALGLKGLNLLLYVNQLHFQERVLLGCPFLRGDQIFDGKIEFDNMAATSVQEI